MDDTIQKQNYLRKNILEAGYDPELFVDYLASVKKDGQNIDSWSLKELAQLVEAFTGSKKTPQFLLVGEAQGNTNVYNGISPSRPHPTQSLFDKNSQRSKVQYPKFGVSEQQLLRTMKCLEFKPYKGVQGRQQVKFRIDKPQFVAKGGLFGIGATTTLWFSITTDLSEAQQIKRTDQDFEWLRKTLVRLNPGQLVPPLKRSKPLLPDDKKSVEKRARMIQHFLQDLQAYPQLFDTKLVSYFLEHPDYNKYLRFRQEINSVGFVKILSNLQTPSGTVDLQISARNQSAVEAASGFADAITDKLAGLKIHFRNSLKSLENFTANLYQIGNGFADLQQLYCGLTNTIPSFKQPQLSDCFIEINNFMIEWGRNITSQQKTMQSHLGTLVKYMKQQNDSVREHLLRRAEAEEEFMKLKAGLLKKKEKVYPDVQKWEIPTEVLAKIPNFDKLPKEELMRYILPKDNQKQFKMREWVSYLNKAAQINFGSYCKKMAVQLSQKYGDWAVAMREVTSKQPQLFTKLANLQSE